MSITLGLRLTPISTVCSEANANTKAYVEARTKAEDGTKADTKARVEAETKGLLGLPPTANVNAALAHLLEGSEAGEEVEKKFRFADPCHHHHAHRS